MSIISSWKQVVYKSYKDIKNNIRHIRQHANNANEVQYAALRMYCHMLDKGLNNISFEKGHSLNVYNKARSLYEELKGCYENDREYLWIRDILERFEDAQKRGFPLLKLQEPKEYSTQEVKDHIDFITRRTSCRNFLKKEIPTEVLKHIVEIAIDAPNGCCRQVVRYYITQKKEIIDNTVPNIAGITNFSNIQCLVCVAADFSYYEIIDRDLKFIDSALSVENYMLGASLYGIYGTICNYFHASTQEDLRCRRLFGVRDTEDIMMFIVMGYPTSIPEKPARRDLNTFYKFI